MRSLAKTCRQLQQSGRQTANSTCALHYLSFGISCNYLTKFDATNRPLPAHAMPASARRESVGAYSTSIGEHCGYTYFTHLAMLLSGVGPCRSPLAVKPESCIKLTQPPLSQRRESLKVYSTLNFEQYFIHIYHILMYRALPVGTDLTPLAVAADCGASSLGNPMSLRSESRGGYNA